MNIGIIVYSETGNTRSVAEKMQETLAAAGHTAEIFDIAAEKEVKGGGMDVKLVSAPAVDGFDALIFGAPVQAFSLCRAMRAYLKQLPDLPGVPTACYVTHALRMKWMGSNRALRAMCALSMQKSSLSVPLGDVHWGSQQRAEQIAAVVSAAMKFAATAK